MTQSIKVIWHRHAGRLVGRIIANDGSRYFAQGSDPDDFIRAINDCLRDAGITAPHFRPPHQQYQKLKDATAAKGNFSC